MVIVLIVVLLGVSATIWDGFTVSTIENCKVIDLQQHQIIKSSDGNVKFRMRYLIITDKETFISETNIFHWKFNNSDVFYHLKKDSTYTFKVSGVGKGVFSDYRNILEVK